MASSAQRSTQLRALVIILLVGFLIGFVPMWLRARQRTTERDQAIQKLQTSTLTDQLSAAALDARRGSGQQVQYRLRQDRLAAARLPDDAHQLARPDR